MSSCRDLGSSGDNQARILDRSSAAVELLNTLMELKELILLLEYCDIFSFPRARILWVIDDGVSRLPGLFIHSLGLKKSRAVCGTLATP